MAKTGTYQDSFGKVRQFIEGLGLRVEVDPAVVPWLEV